jgi:UDP-N-acetyl-D-galactosamine dehydrogenase
VLGLTFKENCPDLRNTRVTDVIAELAGFSMHVDVYDPWVSVEEAKHEYGLDLLREAPKAGAYDAVVLAVSHREFQAMGPAAIRGLCKPGGVLFDVKSALPYGTADGRL